MKRSTNKLIGLIILSLAFLLGSFNSITLTGFTISDSNPASYIIVPMLMLFLTIFFSLKEDLSLNRNLRGIVLGAFLFFAYIILVSYSRSALSSLYMSYRVDALLFPLLLASLIAIIFDLNGIRKLKFLILYSAFASPLILLPIINLNAAFTSFNANLVYDILKVVGVPVIKSGITIMAPSSSTVSISSACADWGAFLAFLMFLLPVAYFYEGKISRKVIWAASGFLLVFVLNMLRMSSIALVWAYYGLGAAVSTFHLFIGQVLFDVSIIVMVVLAYRYGLDVKKIKGGFVKSFKVQLAGLNLKSAALVAIPAFILGLIAFVFSLPYLNSVYNPIYITSYPVNSISNVTIDMVYMQTSRYSKMNVSALGYIGEMRLFVLSNSTYNGNSSIFALASFSNSTSLGGMLAGYNSISGKHIAILENGVVVTSAKVKSGNYTFDVNYFSLPAVIQGKNLTLNYEFFAYRNASASCDMKTDFISFVEAWLYNLLNGYAPRVPNGFVCASYWVAGSIQKR